MVVFLLRVKAELENVTNLRPGVGMSWCLDFKHPQSDETREKVVVSPDETVEVKGSKGVCNLTLRWPESKREGNITVCTGDIKGKKAAKPFTEEDGDYVTWAAFECRGAEPVKWHQLESLSCDSTEGKAFDEVDLTEDDWCDYDDENDLSVGVSKIEYVIERA
mmetsp:Transcript_7052/g.14810  ORF Transcript_7052/g.14810 Transcript_7052/m.14810 type:complete len:163 (-) Transcript_7052:131-619(-)